MKRKDHDTLSVESGELDWAELGLAEVGTEGEAVDVVVELHVGNRATLFDMQPVLVDPHVFRLLEELFYF